MNDLPSLNTIKKIYKILESKGAIIQRSTGIISLPITTQKEFIDAFFVEKLQEISEALQRKKAKRQVAKPAPKVKAPVDDGTVIHTKRFDDHSVLEFRSSDAAAWSVLLNTPDRRAFYLQRRPVHHQWIYPVRGALPLVGFNVDITMHDGVKSTNLQSDRVNWASVRKYKNNGLRKGYRYDWEKVL